jgi:hypothetical protein
MTEGGGQHEQASLANTGFLFLLSVVNVLYQDFIEGIFCYFSRYRLVIENSTPFWLWLAVLVSKVVRLRLGVSVNVRGSGQVNWF